MCSAATKSTPLAVAGKHHARQAQPPPKPSYLFATHTHGSTLTGQRLPRLVRVTVTVPSSLATWPVPDANAPGLAHVNTLTLPPEVPDDEDDALANPEAEDVPELRLSLYMESSTRSGRDPVPGRSPSRGLEGRSELPSYLSPLACVGWLPKVLEDLSIPAMSFAQRDL